MLRRRPLLCGLALLASCAVWPFAGLAFANAAVGETIANAELPTLDGGKAALLSRDALANVFIFFRPEQDHSLDTLRAMAECEREFASKPVHWVAIVSSRFEADDVRDFVKEAGIRMPVLVDRDDALYGRLGVRLHPVVGVADGSFKLLSYEPFHKINYCDRIRGRIRFALHEIDAAALDRIDNPPRALFPNEIKGAVATRHVKMGEAFLRTKQFEKAADEARHVLETEPQSAPAHVLLGRALAAQGQCAEARASYERALAIEPANAAAGEAKKERCGK
jgi:tetratricopeptide (TPR) repeat protein